MKADARQAVWLVSAAFGCVAVWAQSGEKPKFGLADVHVRAPNAILAMRSGFAHGRFELRRRATQVD